MPKIHAPPLAISAKELTGYPVRNLAGERVGKIEEIMLDWQEGRIAYAVLSFGGALGVGNKLYAVPWNTLTLDLDRNEYVLDVDKELLANAPGFDKEHWPQTSDERWLDEIYRHYGSHKYWE
ncbi:MAG: PRC-barrel domain-containing protein [Anaerolineales bacterium]